MVLFVKMSMEARMVCRERYARHTTDFNPTSLFRKRKHELNVNKALFGHDETIRAQIKRTCHDTVDAALLIMSIYSEMT